MAQKPTQRLSRETWIFSPVSGFLAHYRNVRYAPFMPYVNPSKAGRAYPIHTKLGRMMYECGYKKYQVCAEIGVSDRVLTEYLAGRKVIPPAVMARMCAFFDCAPEELEWIPASSAQ